MGAGNEARFVLTLDGDAGSLNTVLAAFKRNATSTVSDIERATSNVKLFANLDSDLKKAAATVDQTRASVDSLTRSVTQLQAAGEPVGKDLAAGLAAAQKAADAAEKTFIRQSIAVDKLRASLKASGVDVANLAAAQAKLAVESDVATKAETNRQAVQVLGIKTFAQARAEIAQLNAAYNTLAASGTLSAKELAAAQQQLAIRTAEVKASVTGAAAAAKAGEPDLLGFFKNSVLPALGLTATVAGVVAILKQAVDTAKEFNQGVAEIGTVTNLTKEELTALGAGARRLAQDLGIDLQAALKGLFDLIRSGVPKENALDVLKISAEAAKAALTDTATGVKASTVLLDAFGLTVEQLPAAFDVLLNAAHNGGASLKEFADNAAQLGNAARATGQDFNTVAALLQVMTDKSNDAAGSAALLAKILVNVAKPETIGKLREMGIVTTDVGEILRQVGEKTNGNVNAFLDLGVASGKAAVGLTAIANNVKEVPAALDSAAKAAGTTKKNLADLYDTPKERAARFNAAINESAVQLGNFVGSGSKLASVATDVLGALNSLPSAFNDNAVAGSAADNAASRYIASLFGIEPPAKSAKQAVADFTEQQRVTAQETEKATAKVNAQKAALETFADTLGKDIKALQDALTRDIADVAARADAQIAALDRTKAAEAATAAATLAIRTKQADDTLALLQANEKKITDALNVQIAAREKAANAAIDRQKLSAKELADFEKKLAGESAAARIAALDPVLKAYQKQYADLVALAQTEGARAATFEQARVDVVRRVEDQIRQTRLDALSGLDQYVARLAEIDRLVSEGRKAAAAKDAAGAKAFFDQAIAASNSLTTVVKEDGTVLITTTQAQTDKAAALKKVLDGANESLGGQAKAAKDGADASIAQANLVQIKITELQGKYDDLKKTVAEGLDLKVKTDQQSIDAAFAELEKLTKPRTVVITVKTVTEGGAPIDAPTSSSGGGNDEHFHRGGLVGAVQRFARGGSVFRAPSWAKVPGAGDGDTVPALLNAGSFVVRKAASQFYGDGLLGALARGVQRFATGGGVAVGGGTLPQILVGKGKGALGGAGDDEFRDTLDKLFQVREAGQSLPHSSTGLNIADWAALIVSRFPLYDEKRKAKIKSTVDDGFDGFLLTIETARRFRVPAVMNADIASLAFKRGGGGPGAKGSDTVPAMLTPGEYVVSRAAVQRYGASFMHAVNNMMIPRAALAGALAAPTPVSHFAMGGPVGGAPVTASAKGPVERDGRPINITFNVQSFDEKFARSKLIPLIRDIERRSE